MKQKQKRYTMQIVFTVTLFLMSMMLMSCMTSCNTNVSADTNTELRKPQLLIIVGIDKSVSTKTFPCPDTMFIRMLCEAVGKTGGTVVVYGIGNPNDKSGFRCILLPIPEVSNNVMMEKQIEQKNDVEKIRKQNEESIQKFLNDIQLYVFSDSIRQMNTDLNGFLGKVDVLLNEPQYQNFLRYVFVLSDGIQSINNHDTPARYNFKNTDFKLCLCGWKTFLPDTMEVMRFESPNGFTEFINKLSISK